MKKNYAKLSLFAGVTWVFLISNVYVEGRMSQVTIPEALRKIYPQELVFVTAGDGNGDKEIEILRNKSRGGVISVRRGTHLHELISKTGEFAVSFPMRGMEKTVLYCLIHPDERINKFQKLGIETILAEKVKAPLLKQAMSNFEYKVEEKIDIEDYTLFKGKEVSSHIHHPQAQRLYLLGKDERGRFIVKEFQAHRHYPQRIVLTVSADKQGKPNVMTVGWSLFISDRPPTIGIFIGKSRYSYGLIKERGGFVYAVPGEDFSKEVLYSGTHSGRDVDKFKALSLRTIPGKKVRVPILTDCLVNFECKVIKEVDWDTHTIFVGEILNSHISSKNVKRLFYLGRRELDGFKGLSRKSP